jgi:glycosyltransferase involved in cell wall biosynthesis
MKAIALPIDTERPRGIRALRKAIAEGGYDVINTHSSTDAWLAALACRGVSGAPPLVRTRHISAPLPRNFATRWLYARATARIVTTGEKLREQMIREAGLDPARVISIPTGIDLARFRPGVRSSARASVGLPADASIVGIVATLRSWKGHRYLLEALAAMQRKDVQLAIVGDGPQRAAPEALTAKLGLAERALRGQPVRGRTLMRLSTCSAAFVRERGVQALMQAMACASGRRRRRHQEIVTDGATWCWCPQDAVRLGRSSARWVIQRAPGQRAAATARDASARAHCRAHARSLPEVARPRG